MVSSYLTRPSADRSVLHRGFLFHNCIPDLCLIGNRYRHLTTACRSLGSAPIAAATCSLSVRERRIRTTMARTIRIVLALAFVLFAALSVDAIRFRRSATPPTATSAAAGQPVTKTASTTNSKTTAPSAHDIVVGKLKST